MSVSMGEMGIAWENMPSLARMTDEQIIERIAYLENLRDEVEDFRDWESELHVARRELRKRGRA